ncbi:hypothetical protein Tco_1263244 [Tanacetum coccineum]
MECSVLSKDKAVTDGQLKRKESNHEMHMTQTDEGPNAAVAFMANLSSTSATNNPVNKKDLSRDQAYWLSANEIASQASKSAKPTTSFVRKSRPPSQVLASLQKVNAVFPQFEEFDEIGADRQFVLDNKNLTIEKKNLLIRNDGLISACDREHTNVLELEAEISKQKQLFIESEKRFAFLEQNYVCLQLKFQNYKQCIDTSSASNAIFEINKLRQQLQGKDDTIRNLDAQINIMKVLNVGSTEDGLKVENVSLQRRYDELSKANTHSRPSTSETPKVLAPGMYNLGSKYVPPPKRANWVKPTPLPKKKQGKTVPKRAPRNHSSLPAKRATARRVEAPHRTLNKQNRVDSNLLVKHSVSVSNLNNVCGACNKTQVQKESLVVQIVLWYLDSGCSRHMTGDRALLIQHL